jgi:hypothetical protein
LIFINNKYTRIYNAIVAQAKQRVNNCYVEKHHIIPKSLGGNNSLDNLVELTAREHFICHRLLIKMTDGNNQTKMKKALWAMTVHTSKRTNNRKKVTGMIYNQIRKQYVDSITGVPKTAEHRKKISESKKGHIQSQETKDKRAKSLTGGTRSDETKAKMSAWQKGIAKPKIKCEHCEKESNLMNYKKWHGDNCKLVKERVISKIKCVYCNKTVDFANYHRWHGDNCKTK